MYQQRNIENDGISNKELLVARSNKKCKKICGKMKNKPEEPAGKLNLSEVLEKLWMHLMVDFITKLPVVAGKNAILVVCNRLSKITHFVATIKETSAKELARLFRNNV